VQTALEVAGPIAASGAAVAKVLKEWWHRNDAKKVTVTFNGEPISLEGMSAEEVTRIIGLARQKWREGWQQQSPAQLQGDSDSGETEEIE
jgi:hypothetical protein